MSQIQTGNSKCTVSWNTCDDSLIKVTDIRTEQTAGQIGHPDHIHSI